MILLSSSISIDHGRSVRIRSGIGGHWNEVPSCCASGSFRRVLLGSIGHSVMRMRMCMVCRGRGDKRLLL